MCFPGTVNADMTPEQFINPYIPMYIYGLGVSELACGIHYVLGKSQSVLPSHHELALDFCSWCLQSSNPTLNCSAVLSSRQVMLSYVKSAR